MSRIKKRVIRHSRTTIPPHFLKTVPYLQTATCISTPPRKDRSFEHDNNSNNNSQQSSTMTDISTAALARRPNPSSVNHEDTCLELSRQGQAQALSAFSSRGAQQEAPMITLTQHFTIGNYTAGDYHVDNSITNSTNSTVDNRVDNSTNSGSGSSTSESNKLDIIIEKTEALQETVNTMQAILANSERNQDTLLKTITKPLRPPTDANLSAEAEELAEELLASVEAEEPAGEIVAAAGDEAGPTQVSLLSTQSLTRVFLWYILTHSSVVRT